MHLPFCLVTVINNALRSLSSDITGSWIRPQNKRNSENLYLAGDSLKSYFPSTHPREKFQADFHSEIRYPAPSFKHLIELTRSGHGPPTITSASDPSGRGKSNGAKPW